MLEIAKLLQDGADAGFAWESGTVSYEPEKGTKVPLGDAPHVKVLDVAKFEANFPGVILTALNGTSIKVACQAVTRRMLLRDRKATADAMQQSVLNALRGVRNRAAVVVKEVFQYRGTAYKTQGEALVAEFAGRIADLVDAGIDAGKAREIVTVKMIDEYGELMDEILA